MCRPMRKWPCTCVKLVPFNKASHFPPNICIVNWVPVVYSHLLAAVQPAGVERCPSPDGLDRVPDKCLENISSNCVFALKIEDTSESGWSGRGQPQFLLPHTLTRVCNQCCPLFPLNSQLDCLIDKLFILFCYFKQLLHSNMTWLISLINIYFPPSV